MTDDAGRRVVADPAADLAGSLLLALAALAVAHLAQGLVLGAVNDGSHSGRLILGRALGLSLVAAPAFMLALADAGELRLREPIAPLAALRCAAVAVAFQALYQGFASGVQHPLLAVPVLVATTTGALLAARALAAVAAVAAERPAAGSTLSALWEAVRRLVARHPQASAALVAAVVALVAIAAVPRHTPAPGAPAPAAPSPPALSPPAPSPTAPAQRQTQAPSPPPPAALSGPAEQPPNVPSPVARGPSIALSGRVLPGTGVVAYGAAATTSELFAVHAAGREVIVTPLTRGTPEVLETPVRFTAGIVPTSVAITAIPGLGRHLALVLAQQGDTVLLEVHDLDRGGRRIATLRSGAVGAATPERTLALAAWATGGPDLYVIDRNLPGNRMRVQELSETSRYRTTSLDTTLGVGGFPAAQWSVEVGPVGGERPDIVLVTRTTATGSGSIEAHVLASDTDFGQFLQHMSSTLRTTVAGRQDVFGYFQGSPTWFSIDPASRVAQPFTLHHA